MQNTQLKTTIIFIKARDLQVAKATKQISKNRVFMLIRLLKL